MRPAGASRARRGRPRFFGSAAVLVALSLAGCRSLDPTAGLSPGTQIGSGAAANDAAAAGPVQISAVAPAASLGPVQFLPVVGTPVPVAEMLSAALAAEAERAGVGIAPSDAPATPLRLKGYLSALGEGRDTVVVYVWDVVDPSGNRLGRIQGQERSPGLAVGGDPWAGVSEATLAAVARRTIAELARMATTG